MLYGRCHNVTMTASSLNSADAAAERVTPLSIGEPAPWFRARTAGNPRFAFSSMAGRYVVLCFLGSVSQAQSAQLLSAMAQHRNVFNNMQVATFAVFDSPHDEDTARAHAALEDKRIFWDFDRALGRQFGVYADSGVARKLIYVMDVRLRVLGVLSLDDGADQCITRLLDQLPKLAAAGHSASEGMHAPVLVVPRVFSPSLCRRLIDRYEQHGGQASGFMRDVDGKTVLVSDAAHKRRRDYMVQDTELQHACLRSMAQRLLPQVNNAFQFQATRLERHLVACYDAQEQGHFRRHRDNTTPGTAHRRFAVSLFLNTGEYEGGALHFPEYGPKLFSAPPGGAVVFSCSLLHEAAPVTRGKRYMYLPFLFDDAAAQVLERNRHTLQDSDDADAADLVTAQFSK
jgi:predicted 2-oxoglutarate/Fe(II)-dependent dioxygenase YbiX/peroxiredoxin